jgi:translation initiation factor 2-alpha kinase 4
VVRYFTAWLEDRDALHGSGIVETEDEDESAIDFSGSSDDESDDTTSAVSGAKSSKDDSASESSGSVMIEFGQSTGGLDFISNSAGYPNVEFGFDSGSEDESTEEEDDDEDDSSTRSVKTNALRRVPSAEKRRGKVTLYIQMSLAQRLVWSIQELTVSS